MRSRTPLDKLLLEKPRDFVFNQIILNAQAFARIEASSGIVLIVAALVALVWANSPWDASYFRMLQTHLSLDAHLFALDLSLQHWVNDGLMTVFFFLMGLEIKREMVHGELSTPRRAFLPAAAALGGMAVPALIFTAFNAGGPGASGWGVPMATDIAFALGVLSLLSRRVPFSIKVFLLALAIADDIGAIVVIALFYTSEINVTALLYALAILGAIFLLNRSGVRTINIYIMLGAAMWVAMHDSGVHATLTGVVLGLLTPAHHYYNPAAFADSAEDMARRYRLAQEAEATGVEEAILGQMEDLAKGTEAPLERLEHALVPWVSFTIVPLFALMNAGVAISGEVAADALSSPVSQGVAFGLVLGKPIGIFLFTYGAVKLGLCEMPTGASWTQVLGVGMLGGIGFTVALLITQLGFDNPVLADEAKLGVLAASIAAGAIGTTFLFVTSKQPLRAAQRAEAQARALEN